MLFLLLLLGWGALEKKSEWGLLAHTYNPKYLGGRDNSIMVQASPSKKARPYLKRQASMMGYFYMEVEGS
jgi:hypothetical protein